MAVLCFFVFIFVQLTYSACSTQYDVEDTICSLCKQRKVCKPGNTSTPPIRETVLFSASYLRYTYVNPGQKLAMDRVTMNIGGLYHKDVGMFISDRDGVFLFSWSILKSNGGYFSIELMLDGTAMAKSFSARSGHETLSGSHALLLKKGSKVWLQCGSYRLNKKGQVQSESWSYFSAVSL